MLSQYTIVSERIFNDEGPEIIFPEKETEYILMQSSNQKIFLKQVSLKMSNTFIGLLTQVFRQVKRMLYLNLFKRSCIIYFHARMTKAEIAG